MAQQTCPHCKKTTALVPFDYECEHCKKPLNSAEEDTILDRDNGFYNTGNSSGKKPAGDSTHFPGGNQGYDPTYVAGAKPSPSIAENPFDKKPVVAQNIVKHENILKKGFTAVAWLVVHTEGTSPITYDIFEGDNFFGRAAENYAVDIPIDSDAYVSRAHACIRVRKDQLGRSSYELLDQGLRRNNEPSTNGTYVNGKKDRLDKNSCIFLQDKDTIQLGLTKLVFKTQAKDYMEAATSVMQTDYQKTVFFKKS